MLKAINHIQITIPSGAQEEAKAFYCNVLGLRQVTKPNTLEGNGSFWLRLGDIAIHFAIENENFRAYTSAHIAYEVSDLDMWRKTLETHDFIINKSVQIPSMKRFDFRDPFGNLIELLERVD
ncbi:VOC family protein [Vibrio penaeicida]|uniref:Glyoxalase n=1 Tax=Vibrio penaeicida TaxID=104609 RepID=A0AAV5NQD9_9VIBR|nr:VOC family protein [Vibrio penaeicida]RTZ24743.1 glyoxalase [Vibrio penaeicida]GLQ72804.1 glyoxalase [Vibrio penaeicida]